MRACDHAHLIDALRPIALDDAEPALLDPAQVGGKGVGLARLCRAGLPVPAGCALPAELYRRFARAAGITAAMRAIHPEDPELPQRCAGIRAALLRAPWPPRAAARLVARAEALGGALSVRSSATHEDSASGACAGQHDSLLGVPPEGVPDAVRRCYASLWTERAVRYRLRGGVGADPAMAVILQRMVPAVAAGVVFTVDPVQGDPDVMVVEAAYGLGESVVSGVVETDGFTLRRSDLRVTARRVGAQGTQLVAGPDGIDAVEAPSGPCLSDAQARAICALARHAEAAAEVPLDVEWAVDAAGAIHLLQSRPITALPPRWTRDESAERFPGPMSPLTWDFSEGAFHASLRASLIQMGLPPFEGRWFARHHHYIYGNQNAARLYLEDRAAGTPLDPFASRAQLRARFEGWRARHAWMEALLTSWDGHLARFLTALTRLGAAPEPEDAPEAWARLEALEEIGRGYFAPNIAISIGHALTWRALDRALRLYFPQRAPRLAAALTRDLSSATAWVQRDLRRLAAVAVESGFGARLSAAEDLEALWRGGALEAYPAFADAFAGVLADHGHCTLDADARQPAWGGAPWLLLALLRPLLDEGAPRAEIDVERARVEAEAEVHRAAGPEAGALLILARLARGFQRLDDVEHYQTTRLHALFRPMALRLGALLVEVGALEAAEDVFFARKASLRAWVEGARSSQALRAEVIAEARAFAAAPTPRWSLDEAGEAIASAEAGALLSGVPGAPGVVTAPVFRVEGPEDFGRFPPGAVLVARTTHPTWTPLFHVAAAVITESGGPLSHGAVTARELGLPAVMGVRGALSALEDGRSVTVNGAAGSILAG